MPIAVALKELVVERMQTDISYYSWNLEDGQAISIKSKSRSSDCLVELHLAFDKFELFVVLFQQDNTPHPPRNWGAETKVGENSSE